MSVYSILRIINGMSPTALSRKNLRLRPGHRAAVGVKRLSCHDSGIPIPTIVHRRAKDGDMEASAPRRYRDRSARQSAARPAGLAPAGAADRHALRPRAPDGGQLAA